MSCSFCSFSKFLTDQSSVYRPNLFQNRVVRNCNRIFYLEFSMKSRWIWTVWLFIRHGFIFKIKIKLTRILLYQFLWKFRKLFILNVVFVCRLFSALLPVIFDRRFRRLPFLTFWTTVSRSYSCFLRSSLKSSWLKRNCRPGSWPPRLIWNFHSSFPSTKRTNKTILMNIIVPIWKI